MAIEFYKLSDHKRVKVLFQYEVQQLELLEYVWEQLAQKTGVQIDFYSTTRLYFDHVVLLIEILELVTFPKQLNHTKKVFLEQLRGVISSKEGLLLEGG